jgi:hypothetical protein
MQKLQLTLTSLLVLSTLQLPAEEAGIDLFNGQDLSGWTQKGGKAKYSVEDGCILGETVPGTPNSFLCTEKTYGNFILDLDFKVDPRLNSGVQIRSECFAQPAQVEWQGQTIQIEANRVHGYQCEIDPDTARKRMWTAGIYDEARRLWLYPGQLGGESNQFSRQGLEIFNNNDWNHLRIVAAGPSIKTYLNNVLCAHIEDSMTTKGFIGLQVHSVGDDTAKAGIPVRFRNLHLKEISPTPPKESPPNTLTDQEKKDGWRLLWDGKTTDGWRSAKAETFPTEGWSINDGVLTTQENQGKESAGGGDIITREKYSSFELKVDFKITPGANSGIKYFVHPNFDPITGTGAKASVGSAIGYEYQVLDDLRHPDAKLGRNGNRTIGSLYDILPAAKTKKPNPIGEWNTALVIVRGNHNEHWLNGEKVLDYDRTSAEFADAFAHSKFKGITDFPKWTEGNILLQEHGNEVSYRNVKIRSLSEK